MSPPSPNDGAPLVPAGGEFEGQIAVLGDTRIAGTVHGSVRGPGRLTVQSEATIVGVVDCDSLDCRGRIRGGVTTHQRTHLGPGAELEGDLNTPSLAMDPESVWNGAARIGE